MMLYELRNLKRVCGGQVILDISRLEFKTGSITSLTGANGAGKTTLLNILAFLDAGYEGTINFCGRQVRDSKRQLFALRRQVVLVDQYPLLFTGSLWKNIEFGLKIRKVPKKRRKEKVEQVLELVGLQDFHKAEGQTLSGGETKRAALARALVVEPDVLLCDEPTANVDVANQEIILDILDRINSQEDRSIIFSTHSLSQVQRLAHRTITLEAGRLTGLVGENAFKALVLERKQKNVVCEIGGKLNVELSAHTIPENVSGFRLLIDAAKIRLVTDQEQEVGQMICRGKILSLCRKNDHVVLVVDAGIRLTISLPRAQYRQTPYYIDENVSFWVPDEAVTVEKNGS